MKLWHKLCVLLGAALIVTSIATVWLTLASNGDISKLGVPLAAFVTVGAIMVLRPLFPPVKLVDLKPSHQREEES